MKNPLDIIDEKAIVEALSAAVAKFLSETDIVVKPENGQFRVSFERKQ